MASPYAISVEELIRDAKENPAIPIVDKLLNRGDRVLIHGYEETFKSTLSIELARCISTGKPFFGEFAIPVPLRVGIIETEMRNPGLGEKMAKMFPDPEEPAGIRFLNDKGLKTLHKESNFPSRIKLVGDFLTEEGCEVVIIDSAVDLFCGKMNPNEEQDVQRYFDELQTIKNVKAFIHIRHDAKPQLGGGDSNKNNLIRGSSRWKEVPETVLHFSKQGNSHQSVEISVGKLRYGRKPQPFAMRFDQQAYTVVPSNPVLWLLKQKQEMLTHKELEMEYEQRYGLKDRTLSDHLNKANEYLEIKVDGKYRLYTYKSGCHPEFFWRYQETEDK